MKTQLPYRKGEHTRRWRTCWALCCIALFSLIVFRHQHTRGHELTTLRLHYQSPTNCSQHHGATIHDPDAAAVLDRYFPQYQQQCGNSNWRHMYAQLHHRITSGQVPPRYLTSVAVQAGMGDRITGAAGWPSRAFVISRSLRVGSQDQCVGCPVTWQGWLHSSTWLSCPSAP